jgi:23S rRNA C2498 (ribose-2'-O)-methylase RlmM
MSKIDDERKEFADTQNHAQDFIQTLGELADKAQELSECWVYEGFNADVYFDLMKLDLPFNKSFDEVALSLRDMQNELQNQYENPPTNRS